MRNLCAPALLTAVALSALSLCACDDDVVSTQLDITSDGLGVDMTQQQCKTAADCPEATSPCKVPSCGVSGTCVLEDAKNGSPCDAGKACTGHATCNGGTCVGDLTCECLADADCAKLNDENACNGSYFCDASAKTPTCKVKPFTVVTCDTSEDTACLTKVCALATGVCVPTPRAEGKPCDDGDACTTGDSCGAGQCKGQGSCQCLTDAECAPSDDGNPCNGTLYCDKSGASPACKVNPATIVSCSSDGNTECLATQCDPSDGVCKPTAMPTTTACDLDGSTCSLDHCSDGMCTPGPLDTPCNCKADADCQPFEDGNLCNGTLFCSKASGFCELNPATQVSCPSAADTACLYNACAASTGSCKMTPQPDGSSCNDGWTCSVTESCQQGVCTAAKDTCACKTTADCSAFEGGNACVKMYCDKPSGVCKANPATEVICPPLGDAQCSVTACAPKTGKCTVVPKNEGAPCEADGSWCTNLDVCVGGACKAAKSKCPCKGNADCAAFEDGNPCNGSLYCELQSGNCLVNPATVVSCEGAGDGPCKPMQCDPKVGGCKPLPLPDGVTCDSDSFGCTVEACAAGACKLVGQGCLCWEGSDCAPFEDGNLCNGTLYCNKNATPPYCAPNPASPVTCPAPAPNTCTVGVCNPGTGVCDPVAANAGGVCDDANACTKGDTCAAGACKGGGALSCDDSNACTADTCAQKTGCVHDKLSGDPCSDGDACSDADSCSAGACQAGAALKCDDGDPCTSDSCAPKSGCVHDKTTGGACSDANACTQSDKCDAGVCKGGAALNCDDGNPCIADTCAPEVGCVFTGLSSGACDDGDACTTPDGCAKSSCKAGPALVCDDGNICTSDTCAPKSGCVHDKPSGGICLSGDVCTKPSVCDKGVCQAGAAVVCNDDNPCTVDSCGTKTGCVFDKASGASCSDGDACTAPDICAVGVCKPGEPLPCNDGNPCTKDTCDPKAGCGTDPQLVAGCGALDFDGVDDRVRTLPNASPAVLPNLTFEAWVFRTGTGTGDQSIVGDDDGGWDRGLVARDGKIYVWAGKEFDTGLTSTLNEWAHFSVVWTPTEVRVSKNGGSAYIGKTPLDSDSANPWTLGALESGWRFAFKGRIDEVRMWSVARSTAELQATFDCSIVAPKPGLLRNFHFDEGVPGQANPTITKAKDSSSNAKDGDLVDFALKDTTSNWTSLAAPATGKTCP